MRHSCQLCPNVFKGAKVTSHATLVANRAHPSVRSVAPARLMADEALDAIGDLGAAIRSTNRKTAEATALAASIDDGPPYRVATVWVVRPTAANRSLIGRFPEIYRSAFPGSSRAWANALQMRVSPPGRSGLVWLDPISGRITEVRRGPDAERRR